ncbi:SAM-dependent methyltransferase [Streptomyces sp. NPDC006798]|uniref:SAM-dependent methyltransferase n=1 Tax=Streptomyces sp. NPDC006798 TaxID=3155462 RepID=UPI0033CB6728
MERAAWAPPGIDTSMPSVARMYDYYAGGSHNFAADRAAARRTLEYLPGLPKTVQADRAFMRRAVGWAACRGVTRFLDIGCGIVSYGNVHQVARAADPGSRVVHLDHDPVAVAHGREVAEGDPGIAVAAADLRRPRQILDVPEVAELLAAPGPVALLLLGVLPFVEDADDPYGAVRELGAALPPESLIVLTHAAYDGVPVSQEQTDGALGVYRDIRSPLTLRSQEHIARFFEGYEMVEPGLVFTPRWRPDAPAEQEDPYAFSSYAGVGRKA